MVRGRSVVNSQREGTVHRGKADLTGKLLIKIETFRGLRKRLRPQLHTHMGEAQLQEFAMASAKVSSPWALFPAQ